MADDTKARRLDNLTLAKLNIKAGIYLFPSSGKTPLIPRFNQIDTEITPEDREAAIEKFEADHGEPPIHVGATNDPAVLTKMFKRHQDCVWSIACGPSKLVVIDADSKDNGPELIGKHFEEHGLPEGCVVVPTQSGGKHYIFKDPEGKFTNAAGALKAQYGCDVRGKGGQYVSPGSIREDGKTYGTPQDAKAFRIAYRNNTLPELPDHIVALIGAGGAAAQTVDDTKLAAVIKELETTDWPEHVDLFEPGIGEYDLEAIKESNPEFADLYDNPSDDCSDNRWKLAQHVMLACKMPVTHLAVLFEGWEGAGTQTDDGKGSGNYNLRDIAREWIKNKDRFVSSGDAFGAVAEDEDDEEERALAAYDKIIEAERKEEREAVAAIESTRGQLHALSDIAVFCSPDYVIENLFTPGMVGMMHGPSNIGKTFSAWYKALCIAEGWKYFGRNVEQSGVLYCYGEGHAGMQNRALAYKIKYEPKTDQFIARDGIPNFATDLKAARKALRKAIKDSNDQLTAKGLKTLKTVFLDTFAKAVAGAEENSTREMQPILNALREIARELGVCIIIIHHTGKDASAGARGASAIFADVDFNVEIVDPNADKRYKTLKVKPGHLVMVLPKMRDSGKSGVAEFKLEEVTLGTNKWGNPVTSMVVIPIEKPDAGAAMGAVADDEEPGLTADSLTADQNRQDEAKRLGLLAKVRAAMSEPGVAKIVGSEVQVPIAEVERRLKVLADLKAESGCNYARELRLLLFRGEPAERLDDGWLRYQPGTGRKPSCLIFSPKL
jgi:hypothetical protein